MASKASLTLTHMNDNHAYFDLYQDAFCQGGNRIEDRTFK